MSEIVPITFFDLLPVVVICYLVGSLPTGYLIAQCSRINIFEVGSGNMGATNIARILGIQWGLLVWFLDSIKGVAAVLIAQHLLPSHPAVAATVGAILVIVGHNWSVFAMLFTGELRGGKGAASAFGTLLVIAPLPLVGVAFAISGALIAITRYMSLGVLVMFGLSFLWLTMLIVRGLMHPIFVLYMLVTMTLIVYRFRENIQRLIAGKERRLGENI